MNSSTANFDANTQVREVKTGLSFYKRLGLLYFLNIVDWLCTETLLNSGKFAEANPIMQPVLSGFWQTALIKGVLPLALILVCALIYKLSGIEENRFATILINIGIIAYSLVNLWHIFNFVLLFSAF